MADTMDTTVGRFVAPSVEDRTDVAFPPLGKRLMLWIDGVGGFLVCLDQQVTIGQAVADRQADVPIVADLSRRHVTLQRHAEGYLLVPHAATRVDGRVVESARVLEDGDLLQLGSSVEFRFRQPSPLSQSARLELLSPHRPDPAADGVLLMAHTCVLGPSAQSHVVCRGWSQQLVLLQTERKIGCQVPGPVEVDGRRTSGRIDLTDRSRVCGEDFCFSLEPLE